MTDLSPEARALIEAARDSDDPNAEQRARVRGKLAATLGATAALGASVEAGAAAQSAALTGASAHAGAAGAAALSGKLVSVLALSGIAVATSVAVWTSQRVAQPPTVVMTAAAPPIASQPPPAQPPALPAEDLPVPTTAQSAAPALPVSPQPAPVLARAARTQIAPRVEPRRATARVSSVAPSAPAIVADPVELPAAAVPTDDAPAASPAVASDVREPVAAAAVPPSAEPSGFSLPEPGPIAAPEARVAPSIERELALIGAAQLALREGDASRALALLQRHAGEFPRGALTQERLAVSAIALCRMGKAAAGRGAASELARLAPSSPLLARARQACDPQRLR